MPSTEAILLERPAEAPSVSLQRQAALPGFIVRKLFASGVKTARRTVIEACKAELAWSISDYVRITGAGANHSYRDGPHPAEDHRMPHEWAAARVLNCWGHLHPTEYLIRDSIMVLRAQRAVSYGDWPERAEATRVYLRLILADRARQSKAFHAAVAEYRRLRAALDRWNPKAPRFPEVSCSQCGQTFGPGDSGFSHCANHRHLKGKP